MPSVHASLGAPWKEGATVHLASVALPWKEGVSVHSLGGTYEAGEPPLGGSAVGPVPPVVLTIASRSTYNVAHTVVVKDKRDGSALDVADLSIATDEDSVFWTLRGSGPASVFSKLTAGEQPAQVEVVVDGITWAFAIDSVSRSRGFGETSASFTGRSVTVAAASPYQTESNWANDGITTAAQMAFIANVYTGLNVLWELEDWLIPDRVFTYSGTPLGVVKRLAEAVGAIVSSDRSQFAVNVIPRYRLLPNEWSVNYPDVEIAMDAIESEVFERADQPEYDGIYLSGQQSGALGYVRLAGTAGATLHPMVTDLLLTDAPALRQRGIAVLGASGGQARTTITLPVLTGANEPGVLSLNQLVRILDPAGAWTGIVRAVSVSVSLPTVRQTVVLERHTKWTSGTVILPPAPSAYETYFLVGLYNGFTTTDEYGASGPDLTYVSVGPSLVAREPLNLSTSEAALMPTAWEMNTFSAFGYWGIQPRLNFAQEEGGLITARPYGTVLTGSVARETALSTLTQMSVQLPGAVGDQVWLRSNTFSGASPAIGGPNKSFEFIVQIGPDEGTGDLYRFTSNLVDASVTATVTATRMALVDYDTYGVTPR